MSAMVSRHDDAPAPAFDAGALMAEVITKGNLANLSPADRASYYVMVCESIGLNPATKPFDYITLNGKLVLYATKGATDQLRGMHRVSPRILGMEDLDGVYVVTVEATTPDGRADTDIGAVAIKGLQGEARANAMMKAITKAKRRVTLSLFGLNMLDETEIDSVPSARPVSVNVSTGEIMNAPSPLALTDRRPTAEVIDDDPVTAPMAAPEPRPVTMTMPRVHAIGNERGLSHDDLRHILLGKHSELASMKDATPEMLGALGSWLARATTERIAEAVERGVATLAARERPSPSSMGDGRASEAHWLNALDLAPTLKDLATQYDRAKQDTGGSPALAASYDRIRLGFETTA